MARIAAALSVLAVAAGTTTTASAAQSPQELRTAIFKAARARRSVHYVNVGVGPRAVSLRMSCDVSGSRGIQRIAFTKRGRTGHVTVLVVRRTAYVRGDAFTLRGYMEFTPAQASRFAGRWISIPHSASGYATVAAGVTLRSLLSLIYPKGTAVRVLGKRWGQKVVGLRTRSAGGRYTETLWASARGRPLHVDDDSVAPRKGYRQRVTLSRWNEPVHVTAPAHAVPIATVLAH